MLQFPTVTVCPGRDGHNWEPDRWGAARMALDSLRFECRGQREAGFDCEEETGGVREKFAEVVQGTFGEGKTFNKY